MRRKITLLFCVFCSFFLIAQQKEGVAANYEFNDSIFHYCNNELEVAKKKSDPILISEKHIELGDFCQFSEVYTGAIEQYSLALKIATENRQDSLQQKKWLENKLKNFVADCNILIVHHPLYTSGRRENDEPFVRNHLIKIFEKYKVPAYFACHEHYIQHLKPKKVYTHHFISGAGSDVRTTGESNFTQFSKSEQGFLIVSLLTTKMLV